MGDEWIPVISAAIGAAAGLIVGVVGIVFTWLSGKRGIDHAERVAREGHDHEQTMAREAREQERRGNAYVRLLTVVERSGQWAQMVKPMLDTDPPRPVRPLPDLDEQAEAQALVNAFGSDEIRDAFDSWRKLVWDIIWAADEIDREQARERDTTAASDDDEPYARLHIKLRPAEVEARQELARRIRAELQAARTPQKLSERGRTARSVVKGGPTQGEAAQDLK